MSTFNGIEHNLCGANGKNINISNLLSFAKGKSSQEGEKSTFSIK